MNIAQSLALAATLLLIWALLGKFLSSFKVEKSAFRPLFIIPIIFVFGFVLRLTSSKDLVDIGFFFTEISYLFTYLLFAACWILDQKKYWRTF